MWVGPLAQGSRLGWAERKPSQQGPQGPKGELGPFKVTVNPESLGV